LAARAVVRELGFTSAPTETDKPALIAALRSRLAIAAIAWIDASVTSLETKFACAPLLGSGGNDGNEDFASNYLQRVLGLVAGTPGTQLVHAALFADPVPGALDTIVGHFLPGSNGGSNAGIGFKARSSANVWDYVLSVEGTLVFAGGAARRLDATSTGAAFPFAVRIDPAGYASAADKDRDDSRLEVWLPLWAKPSNLAEVRALLAEGRARLDRTNARTTVDFARAAAKLGTSRGIAGFERTAFFTRNGNMHYSVPVGHWAVSTGPHGDILGDVANWVDRLHRAAREKNTPRAMASAARLVDEAILSVCRAGADPLRWQLLLVALGSAEMALLGSPKTAGDPQKRLAPLPPVSGAWIDAANDGSAELRLAIALASQDAVFRSKDGEVVASVRGHWMPIDHSHPSRRPAKFATGAAGLAADPDVVCAGRDLERDCLALVMRRVQMASALKARGLGLVGANGCRASLADVMAFLDGRVDDARVLALARPLMAVKWWEQNSSIEHATPASPDATYAILRIAHLSGPLLREGGDVHVRLEPEPVARLSAGDVAGAVAVCLRRLRASGLTPTVRIVAGDAARARRLAASLAFPIRAADASRCADLVTKPYLTDLA
jgi:CRISPR-associated protein Csx17